MICMDGNTFFKISMVFLIVDFHRFSQIFPCPPGRGARSREGHILQDFHGFHGFPQIFADFAMPPGGGGTEPGGTANPGCVFAIILCAGFEHRKTRDLEGSSMAPQ